MTPRLLVGLAATTSFCLVQAAMLLAPLPRLWFDPLSSTFSFGESAPAPAMGLYGVLLNAGAASMLAAVVTSRLPSTTRRWPLVATGVAVLLNVAVILLRA